MHDNRETEIGRNTVGDVGPVFGVVIRAINSPMILQEQSFRPRRMQGYLVYALSELGILIRHKNRTDAAVLRGPCGAAVFGAVDASRRDGDVHAQFVRRVENDRVQSEATVAGHPTGTMRMIEQSANERPCFTTIARLE